jgi:hypothetical protein
MRSRLMALALTAATVSTPLGAEIVVFTTGDFLNVESHEAIDGKLVLGLASGGTMSVDLSVVEHVLEDEVLVAHAEQIRALQGIDLDFSMDQPVPETPFGSAIHALGREYGLNPGLIAAVVKAESAFDPSAVSSQGAQGLMQIMPATAERFGIASSDVFDPDTNLETGVRFLAHLRQRYEGDLALMLAAYNSGEATVTRFGGIPPYRETQEYIRRIERFYLEGNG